MLKVEPYKPDVVALLERGLDLPNLIARLLAIRGLATIEEAERFLYPRLEHLSDPFLLPDIGPAIETMQDAIVSGRKIGVFGDYDADGVTSTALLVHFLEKVGVKPEVYLPARDEGYGLNATAVKALHDKGVTLLVCVDCGSSSFAELETATRLGMEAIILDHHEVPEPRPHPKALVNPKRKDARFPTRELAACGVTFFFLLALRRSLHASGLLERPINLKRELDLVAMGTVGDMVPLTGDNRILVKFGIEQMQKAPRTWLRSFLRQNLLFRQAVDGYGLSFVIIPRINAAGRVSHPRMAFDFLKATEENESNRLLSELNRSNRMRQELEESIIREAQGKIDEEHLGERRTLVLAKEDWPIGVIGIAAQKLAESHGKPCIIFTRVDGIWKGSARGVAGLDLHAAIDEVSSLLIRFGGHKRACGLSSDRREPRVSARGFRGRGKKMSPRCRTCSLRGRRGRFRGAHDGACRADRSPRAFRLRKPEAELPVRAPFRHGQQEVRQAHGPEEEDMARKLLQERAHTRRTRAESNRLSRP